MSDTAASFSASTAATRRRICRGRDARRRGDRVARVGPGATRTALGAERRRRRDRGARRRRRVRRRPAEHGAFFLCGADVAVGHRRARGRDRRARVDARGDRRQRHVRAAPRRHATAADAVAVDLRRGDQLRRPRAGRTHRALPVARLGDRRLGRRRGRSAARRSSSPRAPRTAAARRRRSSTSFARTSGCRRVRGRRGGPLPAAARARVSASSRPRSSRRRATRRRGARARRAARERDRADGARARSRDLELATADVVLGGGMLERGDGFLHDAFWRGCRSGAIPVVLRDAAGARRRAGGARRGRARPTTRKRSRARGAAVPAEAARLRRRGRRSGDALARGDPGAYARAGGRFAPRLPGRPQPADDLPRARRPRQRPRRARRRDDGRVRAGAAAPHAHYSCRGFALREIAGPLGMPDENCWLPDPDEPEATTSGSRPPAGSTCSCSRRAPRTATSPSCRRARRVDGRTACRRARREHAPRQPRDVPGVRRRSTRCRPRASPSASARSCDARRCGSSCTGRTSASAAERMLALDRFDPSWPASVVHEHPDAQIWLDREAAARESTTLDALARPTAPSLMVAMDQRESLRTMLRDRGFDRPDERVAAVQDRGRARARAARVGIPDRAASSRRRRSRRSCRAG